MIGFIINNIKQNSAVAWYGAVVATISIVINILVYSKDRAIIKINFQKNMHVIGKYPTNYSPNKIYFVISVVNKGRRPIKIVKAGAKLFTGDKKLMIFSDSFAFAGKRVLTESEPSSDFLVEQSLINVEDIEYIWVEDGAGRVYKKYFCVLPTRIFKKIKRSHYN
jgi:hypothetical protein